MAVTPMESTSPWRPADSFALRLVILRRSLDLTVDEITTLCGIPSATWSNWESGKHPRNQAEVVAKITRATRVDRDWLMWGDGSIVGYTARPELVLLDGGAKNTNQNRPIVAVVHS